MESDAGRPSCLYGRQRGALTNPTGNRGDDVPDRLRCRRGAARRYPLARPFLDFGCGTGRSARFPQGTRRPGMCSGRPRPGQIGQALPGNWTASPYIRVDGTIPLPDASVDGGVSMNVFTRSDAGPLRSGQTIVHRDHPAGQLVIQDTYWTEDDYVDAIGQLA